MRYYDAAGNISDDDMQEMWAKVLAGEITIAQLFNMDQNGKRSLSVKIISLSSFAKPVFSYKICRGQRKSRFPRAFGLCKVY